MQYKTEAKPRAMAGGIPVFCSHDSIEQVEKLVPNPKNPNQHSSEQIALLARIITATGWRPDQRGCEYVYDDGQPG